MKIVHIAECAGGVDRYLEMLLPRLNDAYEQVFICSRNYDASKYRGMVSRVEQIDMTQNFSLVTIVKQVRQIKALLKKHKPDIVYCHSSFAGGIGRMAALGMKCKVVYNPHGWAFNMKGSKASAFRVIEKLLAHMTDRIVCISKAEYQSAMDNGIDGGSKLNLIENGINVKAVEAAMPIDRKKMGIPEDAYVVGMLGRLTPQKAPDTFVRAARLINEKIPNAVFVIVGNGEQEAAIKRYAYENGIRLFVTGWTDEPYAYLKIFDVAVLLSRWEGFGLAIAEYMAAEKNFVATRTDAIPTIVDEGEDGLLVSVDAPQEVADIVWYYYTHPEEARRMRETAKEKVVRRFDISRVALQHKEMLRELSC